MDSNFLQRNSKKEINSEKNIKNELVTPEKAAENIQEFNKEDLLDCLERYVQRNKSIFDLESQAYEYEKEKQNFLTFEGVFNALLKKLMSDGTNGFEANAEKYEEIESLLIISDFINNTIFIYRLYKKM